VPRSPGACPFGPALVRSLIEVASKEEAIDWTKWFLAKVGVGESRIRQVFTAEDFAPAGG
jgi:hypothetical protein